MFGDFSLSEFDDAQHPALGKTLLVLYLCVVSLLLLNLLIAIVGGTYERIGEVGVATGSEQSSLCLFNLCWRCCCVVRRARRCMW